jgi:hypothetical protein
MTDNKNNEISPLEYWITAYIDAALANNVYHLTTLELLNSAIEDKIKIQELEKQINQLKKKNPKRRSKK